MYWPGLGGGYAFDDYPNIVENTRLHVTSLLWRDWVAALFSSFASDFQRPLAMASFALQHYFTGLDPWPMKFANVALHACNALLVFGLIRAMLAVTIPDRTRGDWAALATTAFWTLLPINLMAVLFIVQRMESLSHTFVFAGLWLYVDGRRRQLAGQPGRARLLLGLLGGTGLGLLSKESAALLPLYALCLEAFVFDFRTARAARDRWLLGLFALVLLLPGLLGLAWLLPKVLSAGAYASRDFSLGERLLTEPRVVMDYLRWTLWPDIGQLGLFHDDYRVSRGLLQPPSTLGALFGIGALASLAWWLRRRRPLAGLGLAWFLSAQLLTATVLPLELVYEHRNYFASLGVALALADLLLLAPRSAPARRIGAVVALALLLGYGLLTHLRAREWSDPLAFAVTSAAKHPASPRATYQLAQTYVVLAGATNDPALTRAAFDALERARRVQDSNTLPAQGLLILAARTGHPLEDAWWRDMHDKLRHRPIGPQELGALGAMTECAVAGDCRFPPRRMLALFMAALAQGERAELLNIYAGYALNVLLDPDLALRLWQRSVQLAPREPQYRANLAKLLIALGRREQAEEQIAALRRLGRLGQYESSARALEARMAPKHAP